MYCDMVNKSNISYVHKIEKRENILKMFVNHDTIDCNKVNFTQNHSSNRLASKTNRQNNDNLHISVRYS